MGVFLNNWANGSLKDVADDFGISLDDERMTDVDIILATYGTDNWSGDAFVLFRKDGKLYEVNGGHCSCYGLNESSYSGDTDTQWRPEETSIESIKVRLNSGMGKDVYSGNVFHDELVKVISEL